MSDGFEARDQGYVQSFDGLQIYWEHWGGDVKGEPYPALFCYGLACSQNQWRTVAEILAPERGCIFFDYRGHHRSDVVPKQTPCRISDLARDAHTVLEHLRVPQAHVFGHSMGCAVALELALAYPQQVASLVLVAGSAENPFKNILGLTSVDRVINPLLNKLAVAPELFYIFWNWLLKRRSALNLVVRAAGFNQKAVDNRDIEIYLDSLAKVSPKVFFDLLRDMMQGSTESILPRIKTPALIVSGGNDQVTPPGVQQRLAEQLPLGEHFIIPLGSHNVQLEFSDYLVRKIRDFWSQSLGKPTITAQGPTREKKSKRN